MLMLSQPSQDASEQTLQSAIHRHFQEEHIDQVNAVECNECGGSFPATRQLVFSRDPPEFLCVYLRPSPHVYADAVPHEGMVCMGQYILYFYVSCLLALVYFLLLSRSLLF